MNKNLPITVLVVLLFVLNACSPETITPTTIPVHMQIWLEYRDVKGNIRINGDTKVPGPVLMEWGDGSNTHGYFPFTHTYTKSGNYGLSAFPTADIRDKAWLQVEVLIAQPEQPQPQLEPQPQPQPHPSVSTGGMCGNKYWPIVEGATWDYTVTRASETFEYHTEITSVSPFSDGAVGGSFRTRTACGNPDYCGRPTPADYYCNEEGIFDIVQSMVLPPENQVIQDAIWPQDGYNLKVFGFSQRSVPAGTFDVAEFGITPTVPGIDEYAMGVGLVYRSVEPNTEMQLVSYNIPGYQTVVPQPQPQPQLEPQTFQIQLTNNDCKTHDFFVDDGKILAVGGWSPGFTFSAEMTTGTHNVQVCLEGKISCEPSFTVTWNPPASYTIPRDPSCDQQETVTLTIVNEDAYSAVVIIDDVAVGTVEANSTLTYTFSKGPHLVNWISNKGGSDNRRSFDTIQSWYDPPSATYTIYPYDEWNVKYIIAEIQFGGDYVYNFYKSQTGNSSATEAIKRWDRGVRVTNADSFQQINSEGHMIIVYAGTNNEINGDEVKLSE